MGLDVGLTESDRIEVVFEEVVNEDVTLELVDNPVTIELETSPDIQVAIDEVYKDVNVILDHNKLINRNLDKQHTAETIEESVDKRFTSDAEINSKANQADLTSHIEDIDNPHETSITNLTGYPTTPTLTKFLRDDKSFAEIVVGSGGYAANVYLTNTDSDISGYKKISYSVEPTEFELITTATNETKLIKSFIYDSGVGITTLDSGSWDFYLTCKLNTVLNSNKIRADIFKRDISNIETILFSSLSEELLNSEYLQLHFQNIQQNITVNSTDRIGIKLYFITTNVNPVSLSIIVGDGRASYFTTPLALRHSQLRLPNEDSNVQHLTNAEKTQGALATGVANPSPISGKDLTNVNKLAKDYDYEIIRKANLVNSSNLYDTLSMDIPDKGINNTGATVDMPGWIVSKIPVLPNTQYSFRHYNSVYDATNVGQLGFLDSNGNKISSVIMTNLVVAGGYGGKTFTTPSNCYYVYHNAKITFNNFDCRSTFKLELGSNTTLYESYKKVIDVDQIPIGIPKRSEFSAEVQYLATKPIGKNKYDKSTMTTYDYFINQNGDISPSSGWAYAKIPVIPNTTYSFKHHDNTYSYIQMGKMAYQDIDGNKLSYIAMEDLSPAGGCGGKTFTTPNNCYYIIRTVKKSGGYNYIDTLQLEPGTLTTPYQIYGKYLTENEFPDTIQRSDVFRNHTIAVFGDSITAMAITQNWFEYVKSTTSFKASYNLARSGATLMNWDATVYDITSNGSNLSADNTIWNQYNKLKAGISNGAMTAPDVVIIAAGTNDAWYRSTMLGDIGSTFASNVTIKDNAANTITTSLLAMRYLVELMRYDWPSVQIIFVTPTQTFASYINNLRTLNGLIINATSYLGVDVIDAFSEAPFSYYAQTNYANVKYDGTHPTVLGANQLGSYMTVKLKKIIRPIVL